MNSKDSEIVDEQLTLALHSARSVTSDLRYIPRYADGVTCMVLLPLIADAQRLADTINNLRLALKDRS